MIEFDSSQELFILNTPHTTYAMGLVDGKYLCHAYYGSRIYGNELGYLLRTEEAPYTPAVNPAESVSFFGTRQPEFSFDGTGDYRESCISVQNALGQYGSEFTYQSHRIYQGKEKLVGLPASFGDNCTTLEICLKDPVNGLQLYLVYSVFEDVDAIVRSARVENISSDPVMLKRMLSACLELDTDGGEAFQAMTFYGAWAREHLINRQEIGYAGVTAESRKGECGHETQPFIALVSEHATQTAGQVYAMHFVYSGNFLAKVQKSCSGDIRMVMGIHPDTFTWRLEPGECFQAPEAVMTYSAQGLGGMTRSLHDFYREHLIRSPWQKKERPILINNWEATYFDFDTEKLVSIAKEAGKCGINLLVCDDGWFGEHRDQPSSGLGDWFVNERKITGGLGDLIDRVKQEGLSFGLWFEPEMISPDSVLFHEHPDWVLKLSGRTPGLCRDQWVLDFSRPEVVQYVIDSISGLLEAYPISYIKWDMNRPLSDPGSSYLPAERQGEIYHRHVLGVYAIQDAITERFPDLLLENCSSGGARFDPGMLYYSPQIWCSDDMDPIERLSIVEGTAMIYPVSTIGAHVCKSPNDITGRRVPFETRALVSMIGTFGYELDITKIPEEEKACIPGQIEVAGSLQKLIQEGDYYRISSYRENGEFDALEILAKNGGEGLLLCTQVLYKPGMRSRRVLLQGLQEQAYYEISQQVMGQDPHETKATKLTGSTLMRAGLQIERPKTDFAAQLYRIRRVEN